MGQAESSVDSDTTLAIFHAIQSWLWVKLVSRTCIRECHELLHCERFWRLCSCIPQCPLQHMTNGPRWRCIYRARISSPKRRRLAAPHSRYFHYIRFFKTPLIVLFIWTRYLLFVDGRCRSSTSRFTNVPMPRVSIVSFNILFIAVTYHTLCSFSCLDIDICDSTNKKPNNFRILCIENW